MRADVAALAELRETVERMDTNMPAIQVATMDDLIVDSAADDRYRTMLMGMVLLASDVPAR